MFGFYKHGLKFFKLFVPSGIPIYILPLVVFIEVLSFFLRPVSHSVRLFANMLAGHFVLKVFAGFVTMLGRRSASLGWLGAVLPLALTVALTALEFLVAFLQAYVFAILTCIYLNDAIHRATEPSRFHLKRQSKQESKHGSSCSKVHRRRHRGDRHGWRGRRRRHHLRQLPAAAIRNPSAAQAQFGNLIFGFAVTEALGIFSLLIALLLLFAL